MRLLIPALLLLSVALVAESADVVCGSGKTKKTVSLRKGDSVAFSTQAGDRYGKKANCAVMFKRSRKQKCKLTFSCSSFDLTAANSGCTKKSDFIMISKKKYCKTASPSVTVTGTKLKVLFKSHKKSRGGVGASCTASCTSAAPPATTEAPGTTAPPATTVPVACTNCSSVDGLPCQFPFYVNGQEYNTCTLDYTDGTEDPWCATKVDGQGSWLHAQSGSYGYCSPDCPTAASTGATACPFRETGFPASCSARHARTHKNILFLGNSYTYGNNLKSMVAGLASGAGFSATVDEKSQGGVTLGWHAANSLAKITGGDWDVVVLQDQSQRPSFGSPYAMQTILPEAVTLVKTIREKNPCTLPLFFQTWGKRDGDTGNCANGATALCTYEGVQDQLTQAYSSFAYATQPARVAPAGEAWRNYASRNSLFAGDGSHASSSGTFLAACTMFQQIWGVPSTSSTYSPVGDAAALKAQATLAVGQENWSYPSTSGSRCPSPMPVSWQCPAKPGQTLG